MEKNKTYTAVSTIEWLLRIYWCKYRALTVFACVGIVMRVALPFAGIALPKLVIDLITSRALPSEFITVVGGMAALIVLLSLGKEYTDVKINENLASAGVAIFDILKIGKHTDMDFELTEHPEAKKIYDKADRAVATNNAPACTLLRNFAELIVNIAGFLLYGGVIISVHPLVIALLIISALLNWLMLRTLYKLEIRIKDMRAENHKKLSYTIDNLHNREMAKDMRLYTMTNWMLGVIDYVMSKIKKTENKVSAHMMQIQIGDAILIFIRDGAAYAFLTYLLIQAQIDLGSFVMIFAAIGAFAGWTSGIITKFTELSISVSGAADFRAYMDIRDDSNRGAGAVIPAFNSAPGIRLENASYTYPEAEAPALAGIDLIINPGERIAVVGANGAGKTTLIKLICGLYKPQSGRVLLEDSDIAAFNRDEYFTLVSVVFQEIHLLAQSIAGNISQQLPEKTDRRRVENCLKSAGLYEKIMSFPEGLDTLLIREINDMAIELSGGEKQKLALARALYKNAPIIILDEPTAALDPIAESETYERYAELTKGKTSIYISHRLASTRFCDRILLLDEHRIAEQGTHDELMALGGKYAEMFRVQASYYSDEGGESCGA